MKTCPGIYLLVLLAVVGCDRSPPAERAGNQQEEQATPTNRVAIPENVRRNLGMTFATVERRAVSSTLRLAGVFELPPDARQELHVSMPGRIQLLVKQYDRVEAGQTLFRLDSPRWREHVLELEKVRLEIERAEADVEIAKAMLAEAEGVIAITQRRMETLAAIEVKRTDLELELASAQNALPRHQAELRARQAALREAREHYPLLLSSAGSLVGIDANELGQQTPDAEPVWRSISVIEVKAPSAGIVETIAASDGGWADVGGHILTLIRPEQVRFRAPALQSDIASLPAEAGAFVVAAVRGSDERVQGTLAIAPTARVDTRSVDVIFTPATPPPWARPGTTAFIEIIRDASMPTDLAIPASAVVKDGLVPIIFLRDRNDPDQAVRTEADLGTSDGRYIAILSGVRAGDEVVLRGAYDLNLATGGTQSKGGHFHPDGTFHEEH